MSEKKKQILSKEEQKKTAGGTLARTVNTVMHRDDNGTVITTEKVNYVPFVSPLIKSESHSFSLYDDAYYWSESMNNSAREQMANRRQTDAELWEMLSFRGMSFADAVNDLSDAIYSWHCGEIEQLPTNVLERFAMCVIRATFRDLIKKGADAYQLAVYDDFRHDIRLEMSRRMAGNTAYEVNRNRKGDAVRACADENSANVLKHATEKRFGSGMDLMHAVIAKVIEMVEYDLIESMNDEIKEWKFSKAILPWMGEEEILDRSDLVTVNAVDACFKACRDEIQRQASIKAIDNGYTYIDTKTRTRMNGQSECIDAVSADDRDGYADERLYLRMKQNIFTGGCTQFNTLRSYQNFVSELKLTDTQMRRLEMKARGYSIEQIAGEEKTTRRAIQKSIEQARAKATEWLMAHEIDASAEVNAELFMRIDAIERQAEQAEQAEKAEPCRAEQAEPCRQSRAGRAVQVYTVGEKKYRIFTVGEKKIYKAI